jgi:hypothetical protein
MVSQMRPFPGFNVCSSQSAQSSCPGTRSSFCADAETCVRRNLSAPALAAWIGQLSNSPSPPGSAMGSLRGGRSSKDHADADRRGPSEPVMPGSRLCA